MHKIYNDLYGIDDAGNKLIENIEDPIDSVKDEEAHGKDDPGISIYDIYVPYLRHRGFDDSSAAT